MREAQAFWRDKVKLSPGEFARLSDEAKTRAFAVSGIARGDELDTVFAALQKAIDQGISFDRFKEECGDIFARRGWTGKRQWRVDNIFRTNIQTAYNVGHYRQLVEDRDTFPYWQYSAINDSRTRPTHLAMDGRVWPADHPVWNTWFPPNGFRCRCSVIGLTRDQVERRGLKVEDKDPTHRLIEPVSPVSGEKMPAMQLLPDPGFAHNPGRDYWGEMGRVMADRLDAWPRRLSRRMLHDMVTGPGFAMWMRDPAGTFPVGMLSEADAGSIGAKTRTVVLSSETARKQLATHHELQPGEYRFVQVALEKGEVVRDGKKTLIYILEDEQYVSVVKATRSGQGVFLASFRRLSSRQWKRRREIDRLRRKK